MENKIIVDVIMFEDDNFFGGVQNQRVVDTNKIQKIKPLKVVTERDIRYLERYKKKYRKTTLEINLKEIIPF